jgi:hypothetical protein
MDVTVDILSDINDVTVDICIDINDVTVNIRTDINGEVRQPYCRVSVGL